LVNWRFTACDPTENRELIAGTLDALAESMSSDVPRLVVIVGKWPRVKYTDVEGWEIL
jgi:hypothetical protein